jgi:hypothetical protein
MALPVLVQLLLNFLLSYLAENADAIIDKIKSEYLGLKDDAEVQGAIQEIGYNPTEESLNKLHDLVQARGEDPAKIAKVLLNETTVA